MRDVHTRLLLPLVFAGFFVVSGTVVQAHDCAHPRDCEETAGYNSMVSIIGGVGAGAVIWVLINGIPTASSAIGIPAPPEIAILGQVSDTIRPPEVRAAAQKEDQKEDKKPRRYTLDIRTTDKRTSLYADGEDALWLYAQIRCDDTEIDVNRLTNDITFEATGPNAKWLRLDSLQMCGAFKAVRVTAWPPSAPPEFTGNDVSVRVAVTVENEWVSGVVSVVPELYVLEVKSGG